MLTRTRSELVRFTQSFQLDGLESPQPAGVYRVDIEEELLQELSFPAYRRTATWICPIAPSGEASGPTIGVNAEELAAALDRDGSGDGEPIGDGSA